MVLHYKSYLKLNSRLLRKNQTREEELLWFHLRKRNIEGYQFYRQRPVDKYIVDFICLKLKLIIEVDGTDHEYRYSEDIKREIELKNLGYIVFRIKNSQVRDNLEGVVVAIKEIVKCLKNNEPVVNFDNC